MTDANNERGDDVTKPGSLNTDSSDGAKAGFLILDTTDIFRLSNVLFRRLSCPLWLSRQRICLQCRRPGFNPWVGKIPWRKERLPTPVFWPGESHGLCSPWVAQSRTWWSDSHSHFLPLHYQVFSRLIGTYSLEASSAPFPAVTTKHVSKSCQVSSAQHKNWPPLKNHWARG